MYVTQRPTYLMSMNDSTKSVDGIHKLIFLVPHLMLPKLEMPHPYSGNTPTWDYVVPRWVLYKAMWIHMGHTYSTMLVCLLGR